MSPQPSNDSLYLELLRGGETLTTEFKGESRAALNDRDLVEAVVCLANGEGGVLFVGVEDDGRVTGARPRHEGRTDCPLVQALVRNRTEPQLEVRACVLRIEDKDVLVLEVPRAASVIATGEGLCVRRVMGVKGPECIPYPPYQHGGRGIALGAEDFTASACLSATWEALDPLQFERARKTISALRGDTALLHLDDKEMAKALRVVETRDGRLVPNYAGLLLFGRETVLPDILPTHQAAFQVLDEAADVRVNEFFRLPLIELAERFLERFDARVEEREVQVGLIRLPVPDYSRPAFREAMLNALFHRDFRKLGVMHVQWFPSRIEFSNPGGFPEGVHPGNILTHEPTPRNPRLYEAAKRIGLVEQTGRGVDKVFQGQLRYGRPVPDYSRSDRTGVRLTVRGGEESLDFAAFVFERDQRKTLSLDEIIILNELFHNRRITSEQAAQAIQRGASDARHALELLVEEGLVQAKGEGRGRAYHFSAATYQHLGTPEKHTRVHGIDPIQHEAMVMQFARDHGAIRRENVMELCGLDRGQSYRLLKLLASAGKLIPAGNTRGRVYHTANQQDTRI